MTTRIAAAQAAAQPHAQVLRAGDAVVAAARRPEQSTGLTKLKQLHGDALQLVKLDVDDHASIKVRGSPAYGLYFHVWRGTYIDCSALSMSVTF